MQREGKQYDLSGDNGIVWMCKILVGTRHDQRLARQHDDARGPSRTQRCQDPQPQTLQHDEGGQRCEIDVLLATPYPQGVTSARMIDAKLTLRAAARRSLR